MLRRVSLAVLFRGDGELEMVRIMAAGGPKAHSTKWTLVFSTRVMRFDTLVEAEASSPSALTFSRRSGRGYDSDAHEGAGDRAHPIVTNAATWSRCPARRVQRHASAPLGTEVLSAHGKKATFL
jgi:hypothetical protein